MDHAGGMENLSNEKLHPPHVGLNPNRVPHNPKRIIMVGNYDFMAIFGAHPSLLDKPAISYTPISLGISYIPLHLISIFYGVPFFNR